VAEVDPRKQILGLMAATASPGAWPVLLLVLLAAQTSCPAAEQVGKWALWEYVAASRGSYANPFTDVRLKATFTSPSGGRAEREGFYDGEDTWRVRFSPDEVGIWKWTVAAEPEDPGLAGSGVLECIPSTLHGPLRVYQGNPLWFAYADGTAVYLLSFHLWQVGRLDEATLAGTLDLLKTRGFNAICGPHLERDHMAWERNPADPKDTSRFDLTVWRGLDRALKTTAERGMVLIPFNILGGTNTVPAPRDAAARDLLLRYWVARWGAFWNATYQPLSEWEEGYKEAEVMAIGRRLYELDGGRHLISVHSLTSSTETVQQAAWFGYHTVQDKLGDRTGQNRRQKGNNDPLKYTRFVEMDRRVPKPIFAHECLWEGNFYQGQGGLDVDNLRKGAWVIALSGGQINYADEVDFPRHIRSQKRTKAANFSLLGATTRPSGLLYPAVGHLARFMRALPFQRLTPHPELASTGVCLAQPGETYAVYAVSGGNVHLGLKGVEGTLTAKWFDPRTGEWAATTTIPGGDERVLSAPSSQDWVLLVAR
jgi:hypothetical protein